MRTKRTVRQNDGTILTLSLRGDEHLHYFVTDEGLPVIKNQLTGNYCLADVTTEGLTATDVRPEMLSADKRRARANDCHQQLRQLRQQRMARIERTRVRAESMVGKRRGLIILADFTDEHFTYCRDTMASVMNQPGYQPGFFQGSVYDYFLEQSNGKLQLTFDVVGPVQLSRPMAYYGENTTFGDKHAGEMVAEACQLAADSVNFADYDWDQDGIVDQVVVIYAGWGEAMGAAEETVWPQEYTLVKSDYGRAITIDGVEINKFAATCELYGNEQAYGGERWITGPGPMCHEFSHCFGLPDFYDTLDDNHFTMADWDIMDSGSYNLGTYCPAGFTGYEKWFCGWQEPIELTGPATITGQRALSEGGDFYIVYNDQYSGQRNEYFILENRQWTGFDTWLYGYGLLITHVNYNEKAWRTNSVNQEYGKERMAIIPANNYYTYKDSLEKGNTYPYGDNDALTDTSTPAAEVQNITKSFRKLLGKPITHIRMDPDEDYATSFLFMGGDTQGIESVADGDSPISHEARRPSEGTWHDLFGRRVSPSANNRQPAVIIQNGKKRLMPTGKLADD